MVDLENILNSFIKSDKFNELIGDNNYNKIDLGNNVYLELEKGKRTAFNDGLISNYGKIRESDRAIRLVDDKYRITISDFGEIYRKDFFNSFFQSDEIKQKLMRSDNNSNELIKEFIQELRPEGTIKEVYFPSNRVKFESPLHNFLIEYDWILNNPIRESYRMSKWYENNDDKWKNNEYKNDALDHFSKKSSFDLIKLIYSN